jgi:aminomethyltransferase
MEMEDHENAKRTPLYDAHVKAGGKLVDFHGWLLPIQYAGILKEHENVRTKAGLFDVSHMGEIEVSGQDSFDFLQGMLTNDISAQTGKAVYSPMCYPDGGTVDDLIVYRQSDDNYLLVVNAANTDKDFQWLQVNKKGRVNVTDRSAEYAQLAIQGPASGVVLQKLTGIDLDKVKTYHYADNIAAGNVALLLSRTGYTGEDGFELYCRPEDASVLWEMLLDKGSESGVLPAGLGARDTLRLEAALPLYGQELSENISPIEAGLGRFVKSGKGDFVGRAALLEQIGGGRQIGGSQQPGGDQQYGGNQQYGPNLVKRLAGFEMIDRAVPRNGYEVYSGGNKAGYVTSGGFFPTLKKNMGLAMLDTSINLGDLVEVKVRDGLYSAIVVKYPFYKRKV